MGGETKKVFHSTAKITPEKETILNAFICKKVGKVSAKGEKTDKKIPCV